MKSAQFIHIETYKQKQAIKKKKNNSDTRETHARGVLAEARREKGFCPHVEHPEEPEVLFGVGIEELEVLMENYISNFRMKNEKGVERKIRKDSAVLLAGVVSLDREDEAIWDGYKKDAIRFLRAKYGDRLKSIIEHKDEAHNHFHFYLIANDDELVNDLHDGKKAVSEIVKYNRKNKNDKQKQQVAYSKAMTAFQDDFFFSVARGYDLERTGEKPRSRLSRAEYKAKEKERLMAEIVLDGLKVEAQETDKAIKNTIKKAEKEIKEEKEKSVFEMEKLKRVTKKTAFNSAINDFKNKNYFQKMLFSIDFQQKKILALEKEKEKLTKNYRIVLKRKNHYKKELEEKEDFQDKYLRLRKDFGKRLDNALGEVKVNNEELRRNNELLTLENERLKNENAMAKYAVDFLNKLKTKMGSKFEGLKNDLFPKSYNRHVENQKPKI